MNWQKNWQKILQKNWKKILGFGTLIFGIIWVIYLFTPHPFEVVPTAFEWKREIKILQYQTVKESDWEIPPLARVYKVKTENKHPESFFSGSHWGFTTIKTYDLETGKFHSERDLVEIDDVSNEPVYQEKYYYEIERWVYSRSIITRGSDQNPYWGEYVLSGVTGSHDTGKEHKANTDEEYLVHTEDGKVLKAPYEIWRKLEVGGHHPMMVNWTSNTITGFENEY